MALRWVSAHVTSAPAMPMGTMAQLPKPVASAGRMEGASFPVISASRYTTDPARNATAPMRAPTPGSTAGPTTENSRPASRPAATTHGHDRVGPGCSSPVNMPVYPAADAMKSSGPSGRAAMPRMQPVMPSATSTGMRISRVRNWANTAAAAPSTTCSSSGRRAGREVMRLSTNPSSASTPTTATNAMSKPVARSQKPFTNR